MILHMAKQLPLFFMFSLGSVKWSNSDKFAMMLSWYNELRLTPYNHKWHKTKLHDSVPPTVQPTRWDKILLFLLILLRTCHWSPIQWWYSVYLLSSSANTRGRSCYSFFTIVTPSHVPFDCIAVKTDTVKAFLLDWENKRNRSAESCKCWCVYPPALKQIVLHHSHSPHALFSQAIRPHWLLFPGLIWGFRLFSKKKEDQTKVVFPVWLLAVLLGPICYLLLQMWHLHTSACLLKRWRTLRCHAFLTGIILRSFRLDPKNRTQTIVLLCLWVWL